MGEIVPSLAFSNFGYFDAPTAHTEKRGFSLSAPKRVMFLLGRFAQGVSIFHILSQRIFIKAVTYRMA